MHAEFIVKKFPHDKDRAAEYAEFISAYEIQNWEEFVRLYDITELKNTLPHTPSDADKKLLNQLIGVEGNAVYLDYFRSNNTFELLMQFQEKKGEFFVSNVKFDWKTE